MLKLKLNVSYTLAFADVFMRGRLNADSGLLPKNMNLTKGIILNNSDPCNLDLSLEVFLHPYLPRALVEYPAVYLLLALDHDRPVEDLGDDSTGAGKF